MEIRKKTWPDLFQKMVEGKKNSDIRLADFNIKEGDTLILEEYDPATKKYTGRTLKKTVKNLNNVKLTEFYSAENLSKHGVWVIELK